VVVSRGTGATAGAFRPAQDKPAAPKVGEVVARADFTVTRSHLIRYAGASGDFNPIHWNSRVATAVGLPDVIAHGMLTMALAGRAVTDWVGDPGRVEEYAVRFSRPVVVPDDDAGASLEVAVQRAEALPDGKKARLAIAASCAGAPVLGNATAVVLLP
jgi:acyl dehydratase